MTQEITEADYLGINYQQIYTSPETRIIPFPQLLGSDTGQGSCIIVFYLHHTARDGQG